MLPSFKERLSSPKGAKRMRFGLGCPFYHFSILLAAVSIPSCLSIFVSPKRCEQKFLRPEVVGCFLPARILPWSYDQLNLNALNFGFEWVKKNINRIKDVRPKKNGWSSLVKISKLSKHEQFYRPIGAPCLMFDTHLFQPAKS